MTVCFALYGKENRLRYADFHAAEPWEAHCDRAATGEHIAQRTKDHGAHQSSSRHFAADEDPPT